MHDQTMNRMTKMTAVKLPTAGGGGTVGGDSVMTLGGGEGLVSVKWLSVGGEGGLAGGGGLISVKRTAGGGGGFVSMKMTNFRSSVSNYKKSKKCQPAAGDTPDLIQTESVLNTIFREIVTNCDVYSGFFGSCHT